MSSRLLSTARRVGCALGLAAMLAPLPRATYGAACCLPDGSCVEVQTQAECDALSGTWQGDGSICGFRWTEGLFHEAGSVCSRSRGASVVMCRAAPKRSHPEAPETPPPLRRRWFALLPRAASHFPESHPRSPGRDAAASDSPPAPCRRGDHSGQSGLAGIVGPLTQARNASKSSSSIRPSPFRSKHPQ